MEMRDNMSMWELPPASANTLAETEGSEGGGNDTDGMYTCGRGEMMECVGAAWTEGVTQKGAASDVPARFGLKAMALAC